MKWTCGFLLTFILSSISAKYIPLRGITTNNMDKIGDIDPREDNCSTIMEVVQGKWFQVYSNLYVQEVLEVDYKCVTANIEVDSTAKQITMTKNAWQHFIFPKEIVYHYNISFLDGNPKNITGNMILTLLYNDDNDILKGHPLIVKITGPIYNNRYEYFILTNQENNIQSVLYIFTWDYTRFMENYNDEVLKKIHEYNFTSYSTYPMLSYLPLCLNKV
jgi:hypothetical protein